MFGTSCYYHGGGVNLEQISLWSALWAATSQNDSERSFENIKLLTDNYSESSARTRILGVGGKHNCTAKWGQSVSPYFNINGKDITITLWSWVRDNCGNKDYFDSTAKAWLDSKAEYAGNGVILNGHYGLLAYLMGQKIVSDLGITAPLTAGGSIDDCECYEGSTVSQQVGVINTDIITKGEIQGPWSTSTKEKMLTYPENIRKYFGQVTAIENPNTLLTGLGITVEKWRTDSKWQVPYYKQSNTVLESGKNVLNSYLTGLGSLGNAGCHIYMYSYMASALTSTVINPVEMTLGLREFGGIVKSGKTAGYNVSSNAVLALNDLGLKVVSARSSGISGDIEDFETKFGITLSDFKSNESEKVQKVVDKVIENNGIVGFAGGKGYFTKDTNHYVVITDKTSEGYKVYGYNPSGVYPGKGWTPSVVKETKGDIYTWDFIFKGMSYHPNNSGYNHQRVYAYNPNLGLAVSTLPDNCITQTTVGDFTETPGQFQGPWGDLSSYVDQISNDTLKERTKALLPYVGVKPTKEGDSDYTYKQDKWKEANGYGVVRYNQSSSEGGWGGLNYTFNDSKYNTFAWSGCGSFATSCVLSTMLGKYINPPEVAIALTTYNIRHSENPISNMYLDHTSDAVFRYQGLAAVISEAGLTATPSSTMTKEKVDSTMNSGGMVIFVSGPALNNRFTDLGHYIVIREKTNENYLIYSSTNWGDDEDSDTLHTWDDLSLLVNSARSGQIIYVTP